MTRGNGETARQRDEQEEEFSDVRRALSSFDTLDVAAAAGALQLLRENGHHLERLEALSLVATSIPRGARRQLSAPRARALLNGGSIRDVLLVREDPLEDVLVEEVAFHGGTYLVGGGLAEHPVELFRLLIDAVALGDLPDERLARRFVRTIAAALRLSDVVLRRAGLERNDVAAGAPHQRVVVPTGRDFRALKRIVRFGSEEIHVLLGPLRDAVEPLARPLGRGRPNLADLLDGRLSRWPFVLETSDADQQLVVTLPYGILAAIRHWLITEALDSGYRDWLTQRFAAATARAMRGSLSVLGITDVVSGRDAGLDASPLGVEELVGKVDEASYVYVVVFSDDFHDYDAEVVFGQWWPAVDLTALAARTTAARQTLLAGGAAEVLTLVVLEPAGRAVMLPMHAELARPDVLVAPIADLDIIARAERNDPLALTKFAAARADARANAAIAAPGGGVLDEFTVYRDHGHVHPMVGRGGYGLIWPTSGRELRIKIKREDDVHPVPYPLTGSAGVVVSVERWLSDSRDVPIYAATQLPEPRLLLLVETESGPVWVRGPIVSLEEVDDTAMLGQMFAFWLWQFAPSARALFDQIVDGRGFIVIDVEVRDEPTDLFAEATHDGRVLDVVLGPALFEAFLRSDNYAERELMRLVLGGLRDLAVALGGAAVEDDELATWLERHAPLGLKKEIHRFVSFDPTLSDAGLPAYRPVQEYDRAWARRLLADRLVQQHRLTPGPIPSERRNALLNDYAELAFAEIKATVADLAPSRVIERLVLHAERLRHEQEHRRRMAMSRMLAYESPEETHARLARETPEVSLSMICVRFLIEYVTAVPPAGTRPLTLAVFDRMLALAAEILDAGQMSDAIRYGLTDVEFELADGLIKPRGDDRFAEGSRLFLAARVESELEESGELAATPDIYDPQDREAGPPGTPADLNSAFVAETGLTFDDLGLFLNTVIELGLDLDAEPKRISAGELVAHVAKTVGWTAERVRQGIAAFALQPRQAFLPPPPPYELRDVYPWRFNRGLSYLRRPLLLVPSADGDDVVWGVRACFTSVRFLIDLVGTGRYRAQSAELKKALGKYANANGRAFEDRVAALYESTGRFIVDRRVKRVSRMKIARESGESLGDIDVLAIEPRQRRVIAADAKAITPALAAAEIAVEIGATFASSGGSESAATRVLERAQWLRDHLEDVLGAYGVARSGDWQVEPLLVLDRDLISPYVTTTPVPVIAFRRLAHELGVAAISADIT
jgi:hypothetical protein